MTAELLRIGSQWINMANVTHIEETGGNIVVTLTSLDNVRTDDDLIRHESDYKVFGGNEARALLWWLILNSTDVMNLYAEVVDLVSEMQDKPAELNDKPF